MSEEICFGIFSFGRRKIRDIGGTHHIAIPKVWLTNHNLLAGDWVQLILGEHGELVIKPDTQGDSNNAGRPL